MLVYNKHLKYVKFTCNNIHVEISHYHQQLRGLDYSELSSSWTWSNQLFIVFQKSCVIHVTFLPKSVKTVTYKTKLECKISVELLNNTT